MPKKPDSHRKHSPKASRAQGRDQLTSSAKPFFGHVAELRKAVTEKANKTLDTRIVHQGIGGLGGREDAWVNGIRDPTVLPQTFRDPKPNRLLGLNQLFQRPLTLSHLRDAPAHILDQHRIILLKVFTLLLRNTIVI